MSNEVKIPEKYFCLLADFKKALKTTRIYPWDLINRIQAFDESDAFRPIYGPSTRDSINWSGHNARNGTLNDFFKATKKLIDHPKLPEKDKRELQSILEEALPIKEVVDELYRNVYTQVLALIKAREDSIKAVEDIVNNALRQFDRIKDSSPPPSDLPDISEIKGVQTEKRP